MNCLHFLQHRLAILKLKKYSQKIAIPKFSKMPFKKLSKKKTSLIVIQRSMSKVCRQRYIKKNHRKKREIWSTPSCSSGNKMNKKNSKLSKRISKLLFQSQKLKLKKSNNLHKNHKMKNKKLFKFLSSQNLRKNHQ